VWLYLRQSVDRYGDELAIRRQREDCLALCNGRGWTPREYVDNDKSATKGRWPAYETMLDDFRSGLIGAVVVWDLDRLHRRPLELEHFIALADEKHLALPHNGFVYRPELSVALSSASALSSAPPGPHVRNESAQKLQIRARRCAGEGLLEVLLGDKQNAFGVLAGECDAVVGVHEVANGAHHLR
jgi:hypothetical protein